MALTIIRVQKVAIVIHIVACTSLVIAGVLFCIAHISYNKKLDALGHGNNKICVLELKKDFTHARNSACDFSFVGEFLAALFLLFLIILSLIKIQCKLMENKICLFVEFSILSLSGIFTLIVLGVLIKGWSKTCYTVHDITKAAGINSECHYNTVMKLIPASAAFAVLAAIAIVFGFFITITIAVIPCLKSQKSDNENRKLLSPSTTGYTINIHKLHD